MGRGRGRLSKIDLLPAECDDVVAWAAQELANRDRTQTDIYPEFCEKLLAIQGEYGVAFDIPSFTAFNRYSVKLAQMTRRLEQTREIARTISERMDAEASDELTLIAAEAIKTLVFELLTAGGESGIDPKGAMQLAAALRSATQAQGVSTSRRHKVEAEFKAKVGQAMDAIEDQEDKLTPDGKEALRRIREDIYGIFK
ncbi:DUF3486 family protein [Martelella endophytica]|uniref:Phage protein n=1 Tax=Martelella endophytica TaxID=1486262 RepID=A0A0D5LQV5_MAREN|nr:DUF3486 family protein [Martelella endophytica]AJY46491.1 phage protein [Martelella endophytica]